MKSISIAIKDLQIFLKARGALMMLFVMPIAFIMMFAGVTAGMGSNEEERIPLPVVNYDDNGASAQSFLNDINAGGKLEVVPMSESEAAHELNKAHIRYALYIPATFSDDLAADKHVTIRLVLHPANDPIQIDRVQRGIEKAVTNLAMLDTLDNSLEQLKLMQAANPEAEIYFSEERVNQQVEIQKETAASRPLVTVLETTPSGMDEVEKEPAPPPGQTVVAGFAVLFVFLSAQNTAQSIFDEKRIGSFRRLIAAPISKAGLLAGKLLPNFVLTLVQIFVIFLTGVFLIPLVGLPAIDFSSAPLGLALASIAVALCSTSLGILIAAIAQSEGQIGGLSSGLLWVAGFLGGSIVPAFMFPESLQTIAKFVPHFWANQAYFDLIFRNETLATVWPSLLILCAFTAVFFLVGVWRFDFD